MSQNQSQRGPERALCQQDDRIQKEPSFAQINTTCPSSGGFRKQISGPSRACARSVTSKSHKDTGYGGVGYTRNPMPFATYTRDDTNNRQIMGKRLYQTEAGQQDTATLRIYRSSKSTCPPMSVYSGRRG